MWISPLVICTASHRITQITARIIASVRNIAFTSPESATQNSCTGRHATLFFVPPHIYEDGFRVRVGRPAPEMWQRGTISRSAHCGTRKRSSRQTGQLGVRAGNRSACATVIPNPCAFTGSSATTQPPRYTEAHTGLQQWSSLRSSVLLRLLCGYAFARKSNLLRA